MALRAAVDFETLNARNSELAALHETAVGLLERLDVDSVLHRDHAERLLARADAARVSRARRPGDRPAEDCGQARPARAGRASFVAARRGRRPGASGRRTARSRSTDYGAWDGRAEGFAETDFHATVAVPLRAGRRGRRRHRPGATQSRAGRSARPRSRSSSASRSSPRSRSRTRGSTRRCSRARSFTAASSTARPT